MTDKQKSMLEWLRSLYSRAPLRLGPLTPNEQNQLGITAAEVAAEFGSKNILPKSEPLWSESECA